MNLLLIAPFLFSQITYISNQPLIAPKIAFADQISLSSTTPENGRFTDVSRDDRTHIEDDIQEYCPVKWQGVAMAINDLESKFNPKAVGDHGNSYGPVQIYLPAHPTISEDQAKNIDFSEKFLCENLEHGKGNLWSTYAQAQVDSM